KKTRGVSLLDMMKKEFAREAEVAAVTHAIEVGILRPSREIPSKSTLPHKLVEMVVSFLVHLLELPVERWRPVVIVGSEEPTGPQNRSDLGQGRSRFHPVERLGGGDDVRAPIRQARLMSHPLSILDLGCIGMALEFA